MKQHLSAHSVANEVRMLRTQHNGALLVVEGASDKRIFRNLVDGNACQIVIAHEKANAVAAMRTLVSEDFRGVLAIVDADFDRLDSTATSPQNVLLTDMHDIECMMFASRAFSKLLDEFAKPGRIEVFEQNSGCGLVESLVRSAMPLGHLRLLSLRQGLNLRFEDLDYHKFIEGASLTLDVDKLITTIKDHSQRQDISSSSLKDGIYQIAAAAHDPYQVCCGHDILEILSHALRRAIACRNANAVKREVLEQSLRLAYQDTYFRESKLAGAIREWEQTNPPYRVLPRQ